MLSWLASLSLLIGIIAILTGAAGLLRLPDFYSRTHAASMTDTAAAGFIILGLMLLSGLNLVTVKLGLILVFLLMTSPTAGHALAQAAMVENLRPLGEIQGNSK